MGSPLILFDKMAWGQYPAEYNPKVHGPYDPSRFYGKADTALADVKLAELPAWLKRRNVSTSGISKHQPRFLALATQVHAAQESRHCPIRPSVRWCHDLLLHCQLFKTQEPHQLQVPLVNVRTTWILQATV